MCKLKIYLTSHNYSTVRAKWQWEVIKWFLISCPVNYNLFVVKRKCFGACSIPCMWLLGGIFLPSRFYFEQVLLRIFLKKEKPLKMFFIYWLKVHLPWELSVTLSSFFSIERQLGFILWCFSCLNDSVLRFNISVFWFVESISIWLLCQFYPIISQGFYVQYLYCIF